MINTSSWLRKAAIAFCAILVACCCGLLTGCESNEDAVRNAVSDEFNEIKNADPAAIEEIAGDSTQFDALSAYGITATDAYDALFSDFDYKIESVKVDGDNATVSVVFTTKDLSDFQSALIAAASNMDQSSISSMTPEQFNVAIGKLVLDTIRSLPTTQTDPVEFELAKKNGSWEMDSDSGTILQNALFPTSVMNSL